MATYVQLERVDRFPTQPVFRDKWFAVAFVLHLCAFVALAITSVMVGQRPTTPDDGSLWYWLAQLTVKEQVVFACVAAICFAMGGMLGAFLVALLRVQPVAMIWGERIRMCVCKCVLF
jgi:hypothetical protein